MQLWRHKKLEQISHLNNNINAVHSTQIEFLPKYHQQKIETNGREEKMLYFYFILIFNFNETIFPPV